MTESKPRHTPGKDRCATCGRYFSELLGGDVGCSVHGIVSSRRETRKPSNATLAATHNVADLLAENERLRAQLAELREAATEARSTVRYLRSYAFRCFMDTQNRDRLKERCNSLDRQISAALARTAGEE